MSKESQNFLQRAMQAYTNYNPFGSNERAKESATEMQIDRNEYLEDQFVDRLDPLKPERGVTPSLPESLLLGIKRDDFKDAGGRINVRNLKKTDAGEAAERLGIEIKPDYNNSRLQSAVDRKILENEYMSLSTRDKNIDPTTLSDSALAEQTRISTDRRNEVERYGTIGPDGQSRTGGSVPGRMELNQANEALNTSRSTRNVNEGTLAINQVTARNAQTQQEYTNNRNEFEYDDQKVEAEIARKFLAAQQSAQYDANYQTIQLQNAAEMERYEMMLENDREVRRGDKISDLIASLVLFGGTMG